MNLELEMQKHRVSELRRNFQNTQNKALRDRIRRVLYHQESKLISMQRRKGGRHGRG
jgi:hypothetical protein